MTTTVVDTADAEADAAEEAEAADTTGALVTCTRQPAQTAARNAKFHSSRPTEGLFTAGTASRSTGNTRFALTDKSSISFFIFYFSIPERKPVCGSIRIFAGAARTLLNNSPIV